MRQETYAGPIEATDGSAGAYVQANQFFSLGSRHVTKSMKKIG